MRLPRLWFGCPSALLLLWMVWHLVDSASAEEAKRGAVLASEAGRGSTGDISGHVGIWPNDNGELVEGQLTLHGIPEGSAAVPNISDLGDVEWQLDGERVTGILNRDGNKVGVFEGQRSSSGADGVFRMLDGREWKWSWVDSASSGSPKGVETESETRGTEE